MISGCLYKLDFPNGKSYIGITSKTASQRLLELAYLEVRKQKLKSEPRIEGKL